MLDALRNLVKSILGKIVLIVMIASFAVWGTSDLFTSGNSGLVAIVGNQKITVNEFYNQFRKKLSELNQSLNQPLSEEEAHNQQITYLVLNEMIYGKLVQEFANRKSLYLSDEIIKKVIISIPQFQDDNGNFNKILFDNAILNNFKNEAQFTDEISNIFLNSLLFENFAVPTPLNEEISNTFYQYEYETRDIIYFNIKNSLIEKQNASDNEILNYYKENPNEFYTKKEIKINYININPNTFASSVDINENEIIDYYNENIINYTKNETRNIDILNAESVEEAEKIIKLMTDESKLDEHLKSKNLKFSNLNEIKFEDFNEDLSNAIFNNPKGIVTNPIEIDELGVFIVKINSISPQKIVSLEKARKEIINLLNEDSIYQIFLENIDLIEEMNLTGSTIEDITDSFNLKFETTNLEALKSTVSKSTYNQLMESEIGFQSDLIIEENDNTYIFEITDINNPSLIPFEESKEKIKNKLISNKTNEQLEIKISELELIYKYTDKDTFRRFGENNELEVIEVSRIGRMSNKIFYPETLEEIFKTKVQSSTKFRGQDGSYGLVFVDKIIPADNLINDTKKDKINSNVNASFNQSMENILKTKLGNDIQYELFLNNINDLFL